MDTDLAAAAMDSLTGVQYTVSEALEAVPAAAGLYAIYGSVRAWAELAIEPLAPDTPLYVGKAEHVW